MIREKGVEYKKQTRLPFISPDEVYFASCLHFDLGSSCAPLVLKEGDINQSTILLARVLVKIGFGANTIVDVDE